MKATWWSTSNNITNIVKNYNRNTTVMMVFTVDAKLHNNVVLDNGVIPLPSVLAQLTDNLTSLETQWTIRDTMVVNKT